MTCYSYYYHRWSTPTDLLIYSIMFCFYDSCITHDIFTTDNKNNSRMLLTPRDRGGSRVLQSRDRGGSRSVSRQGIQRQGRIEDRFTKDATKSGPSSVYLRGRDPQASFTVSLEAP